MRRESYKPRAQTLSEIHSYSFAALVEIRTLTATHPAFQTVTQTFDVRLAYQTRLTLFVSR